MVNWIHYHEKVFMFFKLLTIEWIRLSRRTLLWVTFLICGLYIGLSLANFYKTNQTQLLNGTLKMPGVSFDLANSLDQLLIAIPFLIIIAGNLMGNDYSQHTDQHWLMRAPRHSSLLAKFTLLIMLALAIQLLTLVVGWAVGFYYKTYVYQVPDALNVDWVATFAAPFYMTLVNLPYIALTLLLAVVLRSAFMSVIVGLGYTQLLEFLFSGIFHGAGWTKWLITNLHFSASFLLNSIGNRALKLPGSILAPGPALVTSAAYTLILCWVTIWLYRRQDVGG
jgi:hypothetical protein